MRYELCYILVFTTVWGIRLQLFWLELSCLLASAAPSAAECLLACLAACCLKSVGVRPECAAGSCFAALSHLRSVMQAAHWQSCRDVRRSGPLIAWISNLDAPIIYYIHLCFGYASPQLPSEQWMADRMFSPVGILQASRYIYIYMYKYIYVYKYRYIYI